MKIELLSLISMAAIFATCCAKGPESSGLKDGQLAECPDKPNCVSSKASDKSHFIEPFAYKGDLNKAKTALIETVKSQDRAKIVSDSDNYIHAEFKSKLFRFTDDVEFLIDDKNKTVHIRSASRVGYSDMGVNRKRMESLRTVFNGKMK
jgi:uncharacterized protein (DUF1499 family)